MKTLALLAVMVSSFGVLGYANEITAQPQENAMSQTTNGNFVLYVSNQSFDLSPVDITVAIDGKTAVSGDFAFGNAHKWVKHTFQLAPGKHTLTAATQKGSTRFEQAIEVSDKHWAVLMFWFTKPSGEKKFSFKIQATPPAFM